MKPGVQTPVPPKKKSLGQRVRVNSIYIKDVETLVFRHYSTNTLKNITCISKALSPAVTHVHS
jgi:hypothetical protein